MTDTVRVKLRGEDEPREFHEPPLDPADGLWYSWLSVDHGVMSVLTDQTLHRRLCFPMTSVEWWEWT